MQTKDEIKWENERIDICGKCLFNTSNNGDEYAEPNMCSVNNESIYAKCSRMTNICPKGNWGSQVTSANEGKLRGYALIAERVKTKVFVGDSVTIDIGDVADNKVSGSFILGYNSSLYLDKISTVRKNVSTTATKLDSNSIKIDYKVFDIVDDVNIISLNVKVLVRERMTDRNTENILPIKIKFNKV